MKIYTKIIRMTCILVLLCMILFTAVFYIYSKQMLESRISDQLVSVSAWKTSQLEEFLIRGESELIELSKYSELIDYMVLYHTDNLDYVANNSSNSVLSLNLDSLIKLKVEDRNEFNKYEEQYEDKIYYLLYSKLSNSVFSDLSIVTSNGEVDISTDYTQKHQIRTYDDYFIEGLRKTYFSSFQTISLKSQTSTIVAAPIRNYHGKSIGVIYGTIDNEKLMSLMSDNSGLGDSGESILISKNHLLVSKSRFVENLEFRKSIYTKGANSCLRGNSGTDSFSDYRGVFVIARYVWVPKIESCMIVKFDTSEVYAPLYSMTKSLILFALIIVAIAIVIAILLSKNITVPISKIVMETKYVLSGNFDHKINLHVFDELSVLADTINIAAKDLARVKSIDAEYKLKLESDVKEKTIEMKKKYDELEDFKKAAINILEDLSEMNTHLKDLDQAKANFLNIASHELKTPLTAISAYLEILDDYKGQFTPQQLKGLDAIKRNSNQLKILIGNILEISRIESGRFELNTIEVDIPNKIASVVEMMRTIADAKHLAIEYRVEGVTKMMTDGMRLDEILNNLIGNAIKFTNEGKIVIDVKAGIDGPNGNEEHFVVFTIKDTGVGIPENKLSHLFQNFYQVDSGVSRKFEGTGLGLSITKKLVEIQGGKITVESAVGAGSTFRFILPVRPTTVKSV